MPDIESLDSEIKDIDNYEKLISLIQGSMQNIIPESLAKKATQEEIDELESNYFESCAVLAEVLDFLLIDNGVGNISIENVVNAYLK